MGAAIENFGRRALRALGDTLPTARGGVTVLAYHLVGGGTEAPVDVSVDTFREQLDQLGEGLLVVALDEALERLAAGEDADRHRIVLTFDDAYRNFFDVARPLLEERRLPFTLYVPVGFLDGSSPAPLTGAEDLPAMSWDQVREVADSKLGTIGSHSLTHPDLRSLAADACRAELAQSRRVLEQRSGSRVTSFCYPRALWAPRVEALVSESYDNAVVAGGRRNRSARFERHRLSRLPIRRDMPASLSPLLSRPVWLEEWAASQARRFAS